MPSFYKRFRECVECVPQWVNMNAMYRFIFLLSLSDVQRKSLYLKWNCIFTSFARHACTLRKVISFLFRMSKRKMLRNWGRINPNLERIDFVLFLISAIQTGPTKYSIIKSSILVHTMQTSNDVSCIIFSFISSRVCVCKENAHSLCRVSLQFTFVHFYAFQYNFLFHFFHSLVAFGWRHDSTIAVTAKQIGLRVTWWKFIRMTHRCHEANWRRHTHTRYIIVIFAFNIR